MPLFVYGSLRPGMPLWHVIRDHVVDRTAATVAGRLHWHEGHEWPLLTEGDRVVHGDLLQLTPGDAVRRVIVDEELAYGYDARWISVTTAAGTEQAIALVWAHASEVGPEITGGDYTAEADTAVTSPSNPDRP